MVPRTYPSTFAPSGQQQMVVYFLTSVVGLQRWSDYIPVKLSNGGVENSNNNNGYINVAIVPSLGGTVQAWKDYIPVFQDAAATDAWQVSSVGFIPYNYSGFGDASLILDFTNGGALDSRITFTRASTGTYYDSSGVLRVSPLNLLTFSEQFDNAAWTKANSTVTANAIASPDGTVNADKLVENTAASTTHQVTGGTSKAAVATTYTASIFLKAAERTFASIALTDAGGFIVAGFNLSNGASQINSTSGFTGGSVSTTLISNGWYRVFFTAITTANTTINFIVRTATSITVDSYTGDGTSGLYLWGAQLETGSTATTYIPTTTTLSGAPRFDYNPTTRVPLGLLIEEQRTNELFRSQELATTPWFNSGLTSIANNTTDLTSPSGTNTATKIVSLGGAAAVGQSKTLTTSIYTASIWLRTLTGTITTDLIVYLSASPFTIIGSRTITITSTWQRFTLTTTTATVASYNFQLNGIGAGTIYAWGAQLEAGAFATSYIPTTTAEATRAADVANMTGTNFSSWYNATEGTLYVGVSVVSSSYTSGVTLDIGAGGAFGTTEYLSWGGTQWGLNPSVAPINVASLVTTTATAKVATAIKANDSVISANGLIGVVDTACAIAASPTTLSIGKGGWSGASNYVNGTISSIAYYPRRLSNAELQRLTT
jgi:hypothetical protein